MELSENVDGYEVRWDKETNEIHLVFLNIVEDGTRYRFSPEDTMKIVTALQRAVHELNK